MPRGKSDRQKLKKGWSYEMDSETSLRVEEMVAAADQELSDEARVNFRWGREQLELVKRVAGLMGVPYQTYIKQVVYRQCLQDLRTSAEVSSLLSGSQPPSEIV